MELGSLTKAGEALGYSQSGISHMMRSLEEEVGFPLFVRTSSGIRLNPEGRRLLPIIEKLLNWNEQLNQNIMAIKGIENVVISIGAFSSISTHWLPRIIKAFQTDHPGTYVHLYEGGVQEIEERLKKGIIDIGFFSQQSHQSFQWIPLKKDPLLAVLPQNYPVGNSECFPLEGFKQEPFIMSAAGFDYDIHRVFEKEGVEADVRIYSMDDYTIAAMVQNGLGLSILPELVLTWCTPYVKTMPLKPRFYRSLGIALTPAKEVSPVVKEFIEYTKEILLAE